MRLIREAQSLTNAPSRTVTGILNFLTGTLTRGVISRRKMDHGAGAANGGGEEHARKRVRREDGVSTTPTPTIDSSAAYLNGKEDMEKSKIAELASNASHSREREVGILRWVNEENVGFEGVLKQRYVGKFSLG